MVTAILKVTENANTLLCTSSTSDLSDPPKKENNNNYECRFICINVPVLFLSLPLPCVHLFSSFAHLSISRRFPHVSLVLLRHRCTNVFKCSWYFLLKRNKSDISLQLLH